MMPPEQRQQITAMYHHHDLAPGLALAVALGAGIEPAKGFKKLQSTGLVERWQVPLYLPSRYLDARVPIERFFGLTGQGQEVVVVGRYAGNMRTKWGAGRWGGKRSPQAQGALLDEEGMQLRFSVFGDARTLQKTLEESEGPIALAGTLTQVGAHVYLNNPTLLDQSLIGAVVPHYPGKARVLSLAMARRVMAALLPSTIPLCAAELRARARAFVSDGQLRRLLGRPEGTLEDLLVRAHFPSSPDVGERAQWHLERLSALITAGDLRAAKQCPVAVRKPLALSPWQDLASRAPFVLTHEQARAVDRLTERFGGTEASSTLINADVGMGKSIVYQMAVASAVRSAARAAVLLPNERLAVQAHQEICRLFPEFDAALVTGKTNDRAMTNARWLVGTTALLFRDIGHLDVCVIDEQHRFSVEQRRALVKDGTHVVEISATPIPRTQAMLLYGKLDVLRLTERHSPQDIRTQIVHRNGTSDMVEHLRSLLNAGARVLIVCPRREEGEDDEGPDLPSVARVAHKWSTMFPGLVRALHGASGEADVHQAFEDMATGAARILVATTVVEVGLNIANLRGVVIVHAERFGLSQLHQLRGRLAREGGEGHCYLYLPRAVGLDADVRLQALVDTNDGFVLAEHDMRIRGIGDVSDAGARQHGSAGSLLMNRQVGMSTVMEIMEMLGDED